MASRREAVKGVTLESVRDQLANWKRDHKGYRVTDIKEYEVRQLNGTEVYYKLKFWYDKDKSLVSDDSSQEGSIPTNDTPS